MTVYGDYSRNRIGFFFGLTGPQLLVLVAGALPILAAVNNRRWLLALALIGGWVLLAALVAVPVHGRSAVGWLAAAVRYTIGRVTGWSRWRARISRGPVPELAEPDLPGVLAGLNVHEGPPQPPTMRRPALIQDHTTRTWAVTASITHRGIVTATDFDRDAMGRGLADLLDICSRGELVTEVLFVVRTVPDDGAERAQWVRRHRVNGATTTARINDELAAALSAASVRTEAFCTLIVPESRLARRARDAGRGIEGRARVLGLAMAEVEAQLRGAMGASEVTWLTSPELAVAVRTGFAPADRAGLVEAAGAAETDPNVNAGVPWALAGPSGADTLARCYRHDAWSSASVGLGLPARGVLLGALAPILTPSHAHERRSLLIGYPIKPSGTAERETAKNEWVADMGEAMRDKAGVKARAKERTNLVRTRTLDAKLAAGHALVTPYAVATVTVPATLAIGDFTHQLEASVRRAGFTPQLLDLVQDAAFAAAALPLGVSLNRSTLL